MKSHPCETTSENCNPEWKASGGIFEIDQKIERLNSIKVELEDPEIWSMPEKTQALGKERALIEESVTMMQALSQHLQDTLDLYELAAEENDTETLALISDDAEKMTKRIGDLEFRRMFSGEMDANNAYVDIQSGSGGTEAQDWANMLLRMYLRWGERHDFKSEVIELSDGDVAGIKSATIMFTGPYAFGWLRTEGGVHRLVRKSPFDSTRLLLLYLCRQKLMTISRLILTPPICALIPIARVEQVGNTLTERIRQSELLTCQRMWWCSVSLIARSTRTAHQQ